MTVYIAAAGFCSALGADLHSSWLAYQAGISGYQQSSFATKFNQNALIAGVPESLIRATLPGCEAMQEVSSTVDRRAKILNYAFEDLISQTGLDVELPAYLLQHELEQGLDNIELDSFKEIVDGLVMPIDPERLLPIPLGRASFAEAVLQFERSDLVNALVVATHDPLDYDWLERLDREDRLKAAGVMDGFAPGECGVVILLTKEAERAKKFSPNPLSIHSIEIAKGTGRDSHTLPIDSSTLYTCERRSLEADSERLIHSVFSSHNGESYWNRSMSLSGIRLNSKFVEDYPTIYPAEYLGDTACSAGAVCVLWAALHLKIHVSSAALPSEHALIQLQSDNGWCASAIVSSLSPS